MNYTDSENEIDNYLIEGIKYAIKERIYIASFYKQYDIDEIDELDELCSAVLKKIPREKYASVAEFDESEYIDELIESTYEDVVVSQPLKNIFDKRDKKEIPVIDIDKELETKENSTDFNEYINLFRSLLTESKHTNSSLISNNCEKFVFNDDQVYSYDETILIKYIIREKIYAVSFFNHYKIDNLDEFIDKVFVQIPKEKYYSIVNYEDDGFLDDLINLTFEEIVGFQSIESIIKTEESEFQFLDEDTSKYKMQIELMDEKIYDKKGREEYVKKYIFEILKSNHFTYTNLDSAFNHVLSYFTGFDDENGIDVFRDVICGNYDFAITELCLVESNEFKNVYEYVLNLFSNIEKRYNFVEEAYKKEAFFGISKSLCFMALKNNDLTDDCRVDKCIIENMFGINYANIANELFDSYFEFYKKKTINYAIDKLKSNLSSNDWKVVASVFGLFTLGCATDFIVPTYIILCKMNKALSYENNISNNLKSDEENKNIKR